MKIHVLQHEPMVGPGFIGEWAKAKGHELKIIRADLGEAFPSRDEVHFLIILGGQPGVYEEEKHPWLVGEKEWVHSISQNGKHVFGICMGAQLLADIYGATVKEAAHKEIGWWPVRFHGAENRHPLLAGMPDEATFFQFHKDTFTIPESAVLQAENEAFSNQAFTIGEKILALQFHPEMDEEILRYAMDELGHSIQEDKFIQPPEKILKEHHFSKSKVNLFHILDNFESQIGANQQPEATQLA